MVAVTWVSAKTNTRSMNNLRGGEEAGARASAPPAPGRRAAEATRTARGAGSSDVSRLRPGASAGPRRHRPAPVEGADPPPDWSGEPRLMPPENHAGRTGGRLPTVRGRDDAAQADRGGRLHVPHAAGGGVRRHRAGSRRAG